MIDSSVYLLKLLRNEPASSDESLKYLSYDERVAFFAIFLIIVTVGVLGNVAAIIATIKRKHRYIQKTCIISLALSDNLLLIAGAINNLETFSHPLVNWTLGQFLCSFIPTTQTLGMLASSVALAVIALDRYRNIVLAINQRWNPKPTSCLLTTLIVWIACTGISYPMWILFEFKQSTVVFFNATYYPISKEVLHFCIATKKEELMTYNICITIIIFFPLVLMFNWLYYKVAQLIWQHRKPLSTVLHKKEESSSVETSTTQLKTSDSSGNLIAPVPGEVQMRRLNGKRSIHAERKIQTFKIIILLIIVFICCRLPYHIFTIIKVIGAYTAWIHWIITYVFTGLVLFNCALNPFLYTFLKPTLNTFMKIHKIFIKDFVCKVCCCCCTNAEFEEFEKENPFIVDTFDKKSAAPRIGSPHSLRAGPKNSRVKFDESATLERCKKDRF